MFGLAYFLEWPLRELIFWGIISLLTRMSWEDGDNGKTKQRNGDWIRAGTWRESNTLDDEV
jgi:hypothetical protein